MTETKTVEVTQADRDAAADYLDTCGWDWGACGDVRAGRVDHPVVHALAAYRLASQSLSTDEEARKAAIDACAKIEMDREGYPLSRTQEEIYSDAAETVDAVITALRATDEDVRPRFGSPPEPVSNPDAAWCDSYADWYYQGRG